MKKTISIFLTAVLIALTVSVGASALTVKTGTGYIDGAQIQKYDPTQYIEPSKSDSNTADKFFASATADTPYMFYSYLDANQKALYNVIKENPIQSSYTVTLPEPFVFVLPSDGKIPEEISNKIMKTIIGALSAVADDYPMIFWINGFRVEYNYSQSQSTVSIDSLRASIIINTDAYADMNVVATKYNEMKAVIDGIELEGNTRYEKLKYIHDFIANRVVYDPLLGQTGENPTDHEPTSVFLEPYITVCEGYAEALKLLCDKAGIPCIVVVGDANGGGHAWNYVKMEDNKWYAVDTTWDDQGDIFYDFFLSGSATTNYYFDGDETTFSDSHVNTGKRFNGDLFSLTYPTLNLNAYSRMILNGNSKATVSRSNMRLYIPGNSTLGSQVASPYGYTLSVSYGSMTGSVLTVKNTSNITVETYTVIMWGDVVANAAVDITDYNKVRDTTVSKSGSLTRGTVQYEAGDLNGDGVIDAFDTALLDLQLNDK